MFMEFGELDDFHNLDTVKSMMKHKFTAQCGIKLNLFTRYKSLNNNRVPLDPRKALSSLLRIVRGHGNVLWSRNNSTE